MNVFFRQARPVWLTGREREMNCCMELRWEASAEQIAAEERSEAEAWQLTITGATFYQVFLNGELIHYGPAKKAEGYTGVDGIKIEPDKRKGYTDTQTVELSVRAIGYHCRCYNGVVGRSFVCAELTAGDRILAATGAAGEKEFKSYHVLSKLQKTARYSGQRHFSECWDMSRGKAAELVSILEMDLLYVERGVVYPEFEVKAAALQRTMSWQYGESLRYPLWTFVTENNGRDMFEREELEAAPFEEYLRAYCREAAGSEDSAAAGACRQVKAGELQQWDFGLIEAGFFRLRVRVEEESRIVLAFAEQMDAFGRPDIKALNALNLVEWRLPAGTYTLVTQEPYTVRYAELLVAEGKLETESLEILELAYPAGRIKPFETEDPELMELYRAAVRTFRHNVLDIYMDCPSRERAGWLFDSYYTGKVEVDFTGQTMVEDAFLNNYLVGGNCKHTPGMVEMCYPATVFSERFIPQWGMWYALEVCEYLTVRGHQEQKEAFRQQLMQMVSFFRGYENEFRVLEKLPSWNFVEWSAVNNRVQDVSWATNMLYYGFLKQLGTVFEESTLLEHAQEVKATVRRMAFDGQLFADRAMRTENGLSNTQELSEVTQYYALKFGVIEVEEAECEFIRRMIYHSLSKREQERCKEMEPANALPGLYLRMDILLEWKEYEMLLGEIKDYFLHMARETGTLWEHRQGTASRDHGFASFVGVAIRQATEALQ